MITHNGEQSWTMAPYWNNCFDVHTVRKDFPILHRRVNGKSLIWLDNGATTQKPNQVINSLNQYYSNYNSNIHRGAHTLAKYATKAYEEAREKVKEFIGASLTEEIVFTRGTTEAINLIAESYGNMTLHEGDEILLTMMEHHSNIVPWQKLQQEKGAVIKVIPINDCGEILMEEYQKLLSSRTKIVGITHVSNVLGTVNPVDCMIKLAHSYGACVVIDGAQSIPHLPINVRAMDADFYVFSGHKMYAPTGIGALYGKKALLDQMPPWQRGGGMINQVSFNHTTYNPSPYKFEAGTGNIADAIALGAAIDYLSGIGMERVEEHERELTMYAMERLSQIPGIRMIGTALNKISVLSFVIDGSTPESIGKYLDYEGIAVRAGHHCAQPVLDKFGLASSVRASLGIYNTREEVDSLANALLKIAKMYH
jgi:cysteine desulfurase/selenocysteine lyase